MSHEGFRRLLEAAKDGDRAAMDRVLELLRPSLEPLAHGFADPARPAGSTSDLLQECCLRAWRKIDSFEGGPTDEETFSMFRGWMAQILRRLGLNALRQRTAKSRIPRKKLFPLAPGDDSGGRPGEVGVAAATRPVSEGLRGAESAMAIRKAIDDLPDPVSARIVRMRFFDGLTIPQIAEILDTTPVRVREKHRSAMRILRRVLGPKLEKIR